MGFRQNSVDLRQLSSGFYETLTDLDFFTKQGEKITIKSGYKTDGYSKPKLTESLVGGRFEDNILPAILHDYLCYNKGYFDFDKEKSIKLTFKRVNDLFHEAMLSVGIPKFKALIMRLAVEFNPSRW